MTRVKLIISACIIGVLTGCSYMNLETESPAGVSIADGGPINTKSIPACSEQVEFLNVSDSIPGFDFVIRNSTIYDLEDIMFDVYGDINGTLTYLVSTELFGGRLEKNSVVGYPEYRGCDISAVPGTQISNIEVSFYAVCPEFSGKFDIGVAFDAPYTGLYDVFTFGAGGNTYETTLPSTTVPDWTRRKIYVNIYETANQD